MKIDREKIKDIINTLEKSTLINTKVEFPRKEMVNYLKSLIPYEPQWGELVWVWNNDIEKKRRAIFLRYTLNTKYPYFCSIIGSVEGSWVTCEPRED